MIKQLLLSLFSLLVGLPEALFELEDLTCLEAVEGYLLAELLVEGGDGLLEGAVV